MVFSKAYKLTVKFLFLFFFVFCFISCGNQGKRSDRGESGKNDLQRIVDSGILKVVIDYNSTNYFIYRGKPMGYQYELIMALCEDLDVKPEITVSNDMTASFEGLKSGQFDLIAKNLAVTREGRMEVDFTKPLKQTRQVLVQRKPQANTPDSLYLNSTLEMAGKKIHVQKNTPHYRRLVRLSEEIGSPIEIVQDSVNGFEQLVAQVARGEIDYTVCDENMALLNKSYYPNIDVSLKISFPQNMAWAVRKGSAVWKQFLDRWIVHLKKTWKYRQVYFRYFVGPRTSGRFNSVYHSISGGKISAYDDTVKELAAKYGWDWRLVSSVMYHESRFNPDIESWSGAYGLMQLMPETAQTFGVENFTEPRQNIKGGIILLSWLDKQLGTAVPDSTERVKFVLAAYNVGLGHVKDARRLAEKYGKNSRIWDDNVDFFLRNKSSEKYFNDPVVRWGYCRGEEPYNFVKRVIENYEHYLNLIPE